MGRGPLIAESLNFQGSPCTSVGMTTAFCDCGWIAAYRKFLIGKHSHSAFGVDCLRGTIVERRAYILVSQLEDDVMAKFLLWCILLVICWPLALLAVIAYPFVWLLLLPFRIVGIAVGGVLELVSAIIFLPVRMVRAI